jgi:hypothetical protein
MSNSIDTNIDNYTISELSSILDLSTMDNTEIINKTDKYIQKYDKENNTSMSAFFQDMQIVLLQYSDQLNKNVTAEVNSAAVQTNNWWTNESLIQSGNPVQSDKNTDRKQKIDVYNNPHMPMNREQLGVANNVNLPVSQDALNPNLKNTTSRIIVLDSQYRQSTNSSDTSADYTLDLSEPLLNVIQLKVYSVSIPYTWYIIDTKYGNTCFWITIPNFETNTNTNVQISLESGNYNTTNIVSALTQSIKNAGFDTTNISEINSDYIGMPVYINTINGKLTINLYGAVYNNLIIDNTTIITFFDVNAELICKSDCVSSLAINQTLGWLLGFRLPFINVIIIGNTGIAIPDLYGPKYFIVVLDDLNQNHINNGLIGITELSKSLKMPSYYSADLPYICIDPNPNKINVNIGTNGLLLMDKLNQTYTTRQQYVPSAPRILTQSQLYTINEIIKNNERSYEYKLKAPVVSDTFAILPLKLSNPKFGDVYTEFSGSIQDNKRDYFGPVNISRLRIKLLDDKGNVVNLNGCDWCITIISDNLYQY